MKLRFRPPITHCGPGNRLILTVVMIMVITACGSDDGEVKLAPADPTAVEGQELFDKDASQLLTGCFTGDCIGIVGEERNC
ncbi:MAG: hypothetical protein BMS9Abin02_1679 [Anaerolineae bacterium]|nr:MAG: hypothetical protein BMS9Abin02_1679 [Anaerolineae bacterium]